MRVMVIVKATKDSEEGVLPSTEMIAAMGKYCEDLVNAGIMLTGDGLRPSKDGVRIRFSGDRRTVIDGPFTETNELVAGFWIWKVASMEEAIAWARKCPNPMPGDSDLEIRPFYEADDLGEAFTPELREKEATTWAKAVGLAPPTFQAGPDLLIAGIQASYNAETRIQIPRQWEQFAPHIGRVPNQSGPETYGVVWNATPDCRFDYLAGVAVSAAEGLPKDWTVLSISGRRYAVFNHPGHYSTIPQTIEKIWSAWVPQCGLKFAHDAPCYERYTADFDPARGTGGIEIWVPLAA